MKNNIKINIFKNSLQNGRKFKFTTRRVNKF